MSHSNYLRHAVSLLVFLPTALSGQRAQEHVVPLKNWVTPRYWQPYQVEREAATRAAPQLQFSANAVSTNALTFVAITPCRLVDTRGAAAGFNGIAPFSGPSIPAAGTVTFPVQSPTEATTNTAPAPCGMIPPIAQAYSFNLTVVPNVLGTAVDYVSLWPAGSLQPFVATLNDPQGAIVANAAIVPAGPATIQEYGGVSVYNAGPATTDVIIDMNGYYSAPTDTLGNTAIGAGALSSNTTGAQNTATGSDALQNNTTGGGNTANGSDALTNNTSGSENTAVGVSALTSNTTGANNTASGFATLVHNTTGVANTASGGLALNANTTGYQNTATGADALFLNTTGDQNTANGFEALQSNTVGGANTASGGDALKNNATGSANTAVGFNALSSNTTGSFNIALGSQAGETATTGSNNIHIGNTGSSGDSAVIKIGTEGTQTSAYIAGIYGGTPSTPNLPVCVDANGLLGTTGCGNTPSSSRFKEEVADMGASSSKLLELRPVTFLYKPQYDDGSHAVQYGLIAEEVAKIYPDMAGYDKDGQPSSVKYQSLAPMLLNEVQKLAEQNRKLEDRLAALEALLLSQRE